MRISVREITNSTGLIWLAALAAAVTLGCGSISPLLSLVVANQMFGDGQVPLGVGGGDAPTTQGGGDGAINSVCDLDAERRGIFVVVQNEAQQFVRISLTFAVSAGGSGFVCDDELTSYFNAGYRTAVLIGNTTSIGCDTLQLFGGNSILTLRVTDTLAQNPGGGQENPPIAQPPLNGGTLIPVPEIIVLGDSDPIFTCTGTALCTQRGFVYSDIANNPIAFIDASRTQDTVCNSNAGTAPEWRLGNPNTPDNEISPFMYPAGGTIIITVLDRASNANPSVNQVVWDVFDVEGNLIHAQRR